MEHAGIMGVDRPFRRTCRPGGVGDLQEVIGLHRVLVEVPLQEFRAIFLFEVCLEEIIEVEHPGPFPFSLDDHPFEMGNVRTNLLHEIDKGKIPPLLWDEKGLCLQMVQDGGHLDLPVKGVHGRHNHPDPGTGIKGNGILRPVRKQDPNTVAPSKAEIQKRHSHQIDLLVEIAVGVTYLAKPDRCAVWKTSRAVF